MLLKRLLLDNNNNKTCGKVFGFLEIFRTYMKGDHKTQHEGDWKWNCRFFILQSLWDMNSMRKGREKEEEWPDGI